MAAQKNILLLIADDLGKMTGCYGDKVIQTPNIDRLAQAGTMFDMAFASTASCSGSRSVIYTGLHTHENGQYGLGHDRHHFMTFDHIDTAPALLRDLGHLTGIVGKVHVGPVPVYPWEIWHESPTRNVDWIASKSAEFFEAAVEQQRPFFLTVGFMDPHRDGTRGGFANPQSSDETIYSPHQVNVPDYLTDLPEVRTELAEYYRSITRMDRGIGLILDALARNGLDESTMVIFLSDNGPPFLNSKTTLYDAGVRLPMIIRKPNGRPGIRNPNLVSFVDILPTLLDWVGAESAQAGSKDATNPSPRRHGRSLLPILEEVRLSPEWTRVYGSHTFHEISNYYPTRFIRTHQYKYHRNIAWKLDFPFSTDLYASLSWEAMRNSQPVKIGARPLRNYIQRPPEELFDLHKDPQEIKNLADSSEYHELMLEFRKDMKRWQHATSDPWLFQDGVSLLEMQPHLDAGMKMPDRFDFDVDRPGNDTIP